MVFLGDSMFKSISKEVGISISFDSNIIQYVDLSVSVIHFSGLSFSPDEVSSS